MNMLNYQQTQFDCCMLINSIQTVYTAAMGSLCLGLLHKYTYMLLGCYSPVHAAASHKLQDVCRYNLLYLNK